MKIERNNAQQDLLLYDEERDNKYPVLKIIMERILCLRMICFRELEPFFEAGIDAFKIDGVLQSKTISM